MPLGAPLRHDGPVGELADRHLVHRRGGSRRCRAKPPPVSLGDWISTCPVGKDAQHHRDAYDRDDRLGAIHAQRLQGEQAKDDASEAARPEPAAVVRSAPRCCNADPTANAVAASSARSPGTATPTATIRSSKSRSRAWHPPARPAPVARRVAPSLPFGVRHRPAEGACSHSGIVEGWRRDVPGAMLLISPSRRGAMTPSE
jgi:hypothetical protein